MPKLAIARQSNRKGITLTELVVASVMIGIVMIGVVSFSVAIQDLQRATSKTVLIAMRTKAAMALFTDDAMKAVGDSQDPGIYVFNHPSGRASACFRHDIPNTPDDYSDDEWVCWYHGSSSEAHRCPDTPWNPPPACRWHNECCNGASSDTKIIQLSDTSPEMAIIVTNADNRMEYVELSITARYDNSIPVHPVENPEHTVVTQISPQGHSR